MHKDKKYQTTEAERGKITIFIVTPDQLIYLGAVNLISGVQIFQRLRIFICVMN
jgi:hypothetical protein